MVRTYRCKETLLLYTKHYPKLQRSIRTRSILGCILSVLPIEFWGWMVFKVFSKVKDNNTKRVSIPSGCKHFFGETYDRTKVSQYKMCQFETEVFPIPVDADYYLRKLYGDTYMELPPEEERMQHVVIDFDLG